MSHGAEVGPPLSLAWERLADGVCRTRLPFLDVTVGVVWGHTGALLIDTGTTLREAAAIRAGVAALTSVRISHIVLTHNDFDHILGAGGFPGAALLGTRQVATTLLRDGARLRSEALRYGADPGEVDAAIAARRLPRQVGHAVVGLGGRTVVVAHPGRGHTDHDLIAVVTGADRPVVFCGDLVEESGDPGVEAHSDLSAWPHTLDRVLRLGGPDAVYVPGHGAVVDADFVRRQRQWLADRA